MRRKASCAGMTLGEISIEQVWLVFGAAAQALILACLIAHWVASRRAGGFALPRACIYICIFAFALLAVYAAANREPVFLAGQILNLVITLRVLAIRSTQAKDGREDFPVVAPDRADADADRRRH